MKPLNHYITVYLCEIGWRATSAIFRCAVLDSGATRAISGAVARRQLASILEPNCQESGRVILRILRSIVRSRFFKKCRENELREALAATEQARNGSTGSSIMAQYLAVANTASADSIGGT